MYIVVLNNSDIVTDSHSYNGISYNLSDSFNSVLQKVQDKVDSGDMSLEDAVDTLRTITHKNAVGFLFDDGTTTIGDMQKTADRIHASCTGIRFIATAYAGEEESDSFDNESEW